MKNKRNKIYSGFTLVEVMIATVLIGIAIASLLASNGAFSKTNGAGVSISQGQFLIEQIREMMALLPVIDPETGTTTFGAEESSLELYDDLDDFDDLSFTPPIDINRTQLTDYSDFTQQITVQNVLLSNLSTTTTDHSSDMVRVTVTITQNGNPVSTASWIRAKID
jgi:prepilin-type N-terminal cleavage/methylation domain-containing protein